MPSSSLIEACDRHFSNRGDVTQRVKGIVLWSASPEKGSSDRASEMRSAAELVYEHLISGASTRSREKLVQAEQICRREFQRRVKTGMEAEIQARARYLTAEIAYSLNERAVCAADALHTFHLDPAWARNVYSHVYIVVFEPLLQAEKKWLEAERVKASQRTIFGSVLAKRAGAVVVGAGVVALGVGAALLSGPGNLAHSLKHAAMKEANDATSSLWKSATVEQARAEHLARLDTDFENRINKSCQALALTLL